MSLSYYVGLDLGQMSDFSAMAIVERDYQAKREPSVSL
jgi:phage terminase large subunit-like protein